MANTRSTPDTDLEEDLLVTKVPSKYSQYLEEDNFEKFTYKKKDWDS